MSISELDSGHEEAWNDFVQNNPNGTFFHLAGWKKVMEGAFGFKTFYLMGKNGGSVTGILPLALVRRPLFGPALISSPLCVHGGGLGNCAALEEAAAKKAQSLGVKYLEFRGPVWGTQNMTSSSTFFNFERTLSTNHDENLKAIPRKQRAEVRKGIAADLETKIDQNFNLFYKIYATSVRNLGTPVFPKKYLKVLIDTFGDAVEIMTVFHQGQPLTSVFSFKHKDRMIPYYGGGLPAARDHSAYPYMYWKLMEHSVDNGFRIFDFGRSMRDSGAFAFKSNFGFEPQPLPYHYHLVKAESVPDINPDNPRNKFLISTWKKLPLPVANILGPILYKAIV
ncbi:MAG TPA: FemAB family PEP-CTERM system-associated protein [Alphaproteobacteria bacterium]|nr:FemAB family PEP-CTERM system-associated protein [Micavibrio sp.]HQX27333.1 FemAB family PEP-CTERM system-associated protein [Alphaproteobacteria bacterium]